MNRQLIAWSLCIWLLVSQYCFSDRPLFEAEPLNQYSVTSPDGTTVLNVTLKRFDREKIRQVGIGQTAEAWLDDQKVPYELLWRKPTMITSLSLKIDDKKITIPERFWNDLIGLDLNEVVINKKPTTPQERINLANFTEYLWNPTVSRSRDGGTALITWIRPEE